MVRKLKPEVKQQWIAALRSGEYKQAFGGLRNHHNAMCCLGVLCNLHAQAHPDIAEAQPVKTAYMGEIGVPPPAVMKWAFDHWTNNDHRVVPFREHCYDARDRKTYGGHTHLATLNDSREYSFKQIANVIDKYL